MTAVQSNTNEELSIDYKWQSKNNLVVVLWFNQAMNFDALTTEQVLITATNEELLTKGNSWFLDKTHLSLNIINDNVLQLSLSQLSSDITYLNIQLNNSTISTLTSRLGKQLDGDKDGAEGGVFNYELSL